jgi:hypothetical protein
MAVVQPGALLADIRGRLGSHVYTRTQGGLTARQLVTPRDDKTAPQLAARAALTILSRAWSATLTDPQRLAWAAYDATHPRNNRWGTPLPPNGYLRYIAINAHYARTEAAILTLDPPTAPPLPSPTVPLTQDPYATLKVSGDCDPDATGIYHLYGTDTGCQRWLREDGAYQIRRNVPAVYWQLRPYPTATGPYHVHPFDYIGPYDPIHEATGNPIVEALPDEAAVLIPQSWPHHPTLPAEADLYLYQATPIAAGATYFPGPFRLAGRVTRTAGAWEANPLIQLLPYPTAPDLRVRIDVVLQDRTTKAISRRSPIHTPYAKLPT